MTSGQREKIAFAASVLVVLVCAVVAVRVWRSPESEPLVETETPERYNLVTTQEARSALMANSKLSLPAITSVAESTTSELPDSIQALLMPEARVVSIRSMRDQEGREGFLIIYDLGKDMNTGFALVRRSFGSDWKTLTATGTARFGLAEKESSTYRAQAEVTLLEQDHLRVLLRIHSIR